MAPVRRLQPVDCAISNLKKVLLHQLRQTQLFRGDDYAKDTFQQTKARRVNVGLQRVCGGPVDQCQKGVAEGQRFLDE